MSNVFKLLVIVIFLLGQFSAISVSKYSTIQDEGVLVNDGFLISNPTTNDIETIRNFHKDKWKPKTIDSLDNLEYTVDYNTSSLEDEIMYDVISERSNHKNKINNHSQNVINRTVSNKTNEEFLEANLRPIQISLEGKKLNKRRLENQDLGKEYSESIIEDKDVEVIEDRSDKVIEGKSKNATEDKAGNVAIDKIIPDESDDTIPDQSETVTPTSDQEKPKKSTSVDAFKRIIQEQSDSAIIAAIQEEFGSLSSNENERLLLNLKKLEEANLGKFEEANPDKSRKANPGKSRKTNPGKSRKANPGKSGKANPGKSGEAKSDKSEGVNPKSEGAKPDKSEGANPGKSEGANPDKSIIAKPSISEPSVTSIESKWTIDEESGRVTSGKPENVEKKPEKKLLIKKIQSKDLIKKNKFPKINKQTLKEDKNLQQQLVTFLSNKSEKPSNNLKEPISGGSKLEEKTEQKESGTFFNKDGKKKKIYNATKEVKRLKAHKSRVIPKTIEYRPVLINEKKKKIFRKDDRKSGGSSENNKRKKILAIRITSKKSLNKKLTKNKHKSNSKLNKSPKHQLFSKSEIWTKIPKVKYWVKTPKVFIKSKSTENISKGPKIIFWKVMGSNSTLDLGQFKTNEKRIETKENINKRELSDEEIDEVTKTNDNQSDDISYLISDESRINLLPISNDLDGKKIEDRKFSTYFDRGLNETIKALENVISVEDRLNMDSLGSVVFNVDSLKDIDEFVIDWNNLTSQEDVMTNLKKFVDIDASTVHPNILDENWRNMSSKSRILNELAFYKDIFTEDDLNTVYIRRKSLEKDLRKFDNRSRRSLSLDCNVTDDSDCEVKSSGINLFRDLILATYGNRSGYYFHRGNFNGSSSSLDEKYRSISSGSILLDESDFRSLFLNGSLLDIPSTNRSIYWNNFTGSLIQSGSISKSSLFQGDYFNKALPVENSSILLSDFNIMIVNKTIENVTTPPVVDFNGSIYLDETFPKVQKLDDNKTDFKSIFVKRSAPKYIKTPNGKNKFKKPITFNYNKNMKIKLDSSDLMKLDLLKSGGYKKFKPDMTQLFLENTEHEFVERESSEENPSNEDNPRTNPQYDQYNFDSSQNESRHENFNIEASEIIPIVHYIPDEESDPLRADPFEDTKDEEILWDETYSVPFEQVFSEDDTFDPDFIKNPPIEDTKHEQINWETIGITPRKQEITEEEEWDSTEPSPAQEETPEEEQIDWDHENITQDISPEEDKTEEDNREHKDESTEQVDWGSNDPITNKTDSKDDLINSDNTENELYSTEFNKNNKNKVLANLDFSYMNDITRKPKVTWDVPEKMTLKTLYSKNNWNLRKKREINSNKQELEDILKYRYEQLFNRQNNSTLSDFLLNRTILEVDGIGLETEVDFFEVTTEKFLEVINLLGGINVTFGNESRLVVDENNPYRRDVGLSEEENLEEREMDLNSREDKVEITKKLIRNLINEVSYNNIDLKNLLDKNVVEKKSLENSFGKKLEKSEMILRNMKEKLVGVEKNTGNDEKGDGIVEENLGDIESRKYIENNNMEDDLKDEINTVSDERKQLLNEHMSLKKLANSLKKFEVDSKNDDFQKIMVSLSNVLNENLDVYEERKMSVPQPVVPKNNSNSQEDLSGSNEGNDTTRKNNDEESLESDSEENSSGESKEEDIKNKTSQIFFLNKNYIGSLTSLDTSDSLQDEDLIIKHNFKTLNQDFLSNDIPNNSHENDSETIKNHPNIIHEDFLYTPRNFQNTSQDFENIQNQTKKNINKPNHLYHSYYFQKIPLDLKNITNPVTIRKFFGFPTTSEAEDSASDDLNDFFVDDLDNASFENVPSNENSSDDLENITLKKDPLYLETVQNLDSTENKLEEYDDSKNSDYDDDEFVKSETSYKGYHLRYSRNVTPIEKNETFPSPFLSSKNNTFLSDTIKISSKSPKNNTIFFLNIKNESKGLQNDTFGSSNKTSKNDQVLKSKNQTEPPRRSKNETTLSGKSKSEIKPPGVSKNETIFYVKSENETVRISKNWTSLSGKNAEASSRSSENEKSPLGNLTINSNKLQNSLILESSKNESEISGEEKESIDDSSEELILFEIHTPENTSLATNNVSLKFDNSTLEVGFFLEKNNSTLETGKFLTDNLLNVDSSMEIDNISKEMRKYPLEYYWKKSDTSTLKIENSSVEIKVSSLEIDNPYAEIGNPFQDIENPSREIANSSQEIGNSSQEIGNSSQEIGNSSQDIGNSSQEKGNSFQEIENSSQEIGNSFQETESHSLETETSSMEIGYPPLEIESSSTDIEDSSMDVEYSSLEIEYPSIEAKNSSLARETSSVEVIISSQESESSLEIESSSMEINSSQTKNSKVKTCSLSKAGTNNSSIESFSLKNTTSKKNVTMSQTKKTSIFRIFELIFGKMLRNDKHTGRTRLDDNLKNLLVDTLNEVAFSTISFNRTQNPQRKYMEQDLKELLISTLGEVSFSRIHNDTREYKRRKSPEEDIKKFLLETLNDVTIRNESEDLKNLNEIAFSQVSYNDSTEHTRRKSLEQDLKKLLVDTLNEVAFSNSTRNNSVHIRRKSLEQDLKNWLITTLNEVSFSNANDDDSKKQHIRRKSLEQDLKNLLRDILNEFALINSVENDLENIRHKKLEQDIKKLLASTLTEILTINKNSTYTTSHEILQEDIKNFMLSILNDVVFTPIHNSQKNSTKLKNLKQDLKDVLQAIFIEVIVDRTKRGIRKDFFSHEFFLDENQAQRFIKYLQQFIRTHNQERRKKRWQNDDTNKDARNEMDEELSNEGIFYDEVTSEEISGTEEKNKETKNEETTSEIKNEGIENRELDDETIIFDKEINNTMNEENAINEEITNDDIKNETIKNEYTMSEDVKEKEIERANSEEIIYEKPIKNDEITKELLKNITVESTESEVSSDYIINTIVNHENETNGEIEGAYVKNEDILSEYKNEEIIEDIKNEDFTNDTKKEELNVTVRNEDLEDVINEDVSNENGTNIDSSNEDNVQIPNDDVKSEISEEIITDDTYDEDLKLEEPKISSEDMKKRTFLRRNKRNVKKVMKYLNRGLKGKKYRKQKRDDNKARRQNCIGIKKCGGVKRKNAIKRKNGKVFKEGLVVRGKKSENRNNGRKRCKVIKKINGRSKEISYVKLCKNHKKLINKGNFQNSLLKKKRIKEKHEENKNNVVSIKKWSDMIKKEHKGNDSKLEEKKKTNGNESDKEKNIEKHGQFFRDVVKKLYTPLKLEKNPHGRNTTSKNLIGEQKNNDLDNFQIPKRSRRQIKNITPDKLNETLDGQKNHKSKKRSYIQINPPKNLSKREINNEEIDTNSETAIANHDSEKSLGQKLEQTPAQKTKASKRESKENSESNEIMTGSGEKNDINKLDNESDQEVAESDEESDDETEDESDDSEEESEDESDLESNEESEKETEEELDEEEDEEENDDSEETRPRKRNRKKYGKKEKLNSLRKRRNRHRKLRRNQIKDSAPKRVKFFRIKNGRRRFGRNGARKQSVIWKIRRWINWVKSKRRQYLKKNRIKTEEHIRKKHKGRKRKGHKHKKGHKKNKKNENDSVETKKSITHNHYNQKISSNSIDSKNIKEVEDKKENDIDSNNISIKIKDDNGLNDGGVNKTELNNTVKDSIEINYSGETNKIEAKKIEEYFQEKAIQTSDESKNETKNETKINNEESKKNDEPKTNNELPQKNNDETKKVNDEINNEKTAEELKKNSIKPKQLLDELKKILEKTKKSEEESKKKLEFSKKKFDIKKPTKTKLKLESKKKLNASKNSLDKKKSNPKNESDKNNFLKNLTENMKADHAKSFIVLWQRDTPKRNFKRHVSENDENIQENLEDFFLAANPNSDNFLFLGQKKSSTFDLNISYNTSTFLDSKTSNKIKRTPHYRRTLDQQLGDVPKYSNTSIFNLAQKSQFESFDSNSLKKRAEFDFLDYNEAPDMDQKESQFETFKETRTQMEPEFDTFEPDFRHDVQFETFKPNVIDDINFESLDTVVHSKSDLMKINKRQIKFDDFSDFYTLYDETDGSYDRPPFWTRIIPGLTQEDLASNHVTEFHENSYENRLNDDTYYGYSNWQFFPENNTNQVINKVRKQKQFKRNHKCGLRKNFHRFDQDQDDSKDETDCNQKFGYETEPDYSTLNYNMKSDYDPQVYNRYKTEEFDYMKEQVNFPKPASFHKPFDKQQNIFYKPDQIWYQPDSEDGNLRSRDSVDFGKLYNVHSGNFLRTLDSGILNPGYVRNFRNSDINININPKNLNSAKLTPARSDSLNLNPTRYDSAVSNSADMNPTILDSTILNSDRLNSPSISSDFFDSDLLNSADQNPENFIQSENSDSLESGYFETTNIFDNKYNFENQENSEPEDENIFQKSLRKYPKIESNLDDTMITLKTNDNHDFDLSNYEPRKNHRFSNKIRNIILKPSDFEPKKSHFKVPAEMRDYSGDQSDPIPNKNKKKNSIPKKLAKKNLEEIPDEVSVRNSKNLRAITSFNDSSSLKIFLNELEDELDIPVEPTIDEDSKPKIKSRPKKVGHKTVRVKEIKDRVVPKRKNVVRKMKKRKKMRIPKNVEDWMENMPIDFRVKTKKENTVNRKRKDITKNEENIDGENEKKTDLDNFKEELLGGPDTTENIVVKKKSNTTQKNSKKFDTTDKSWFLDDLEESFNENNQSNESIPLKKITFFNTELKSSQKRSESSIDKDNSDKYLFGSAIMNEKIMEEMNKLHSRNKYFFQKKHMKKTTPRPSKEPREQLDLDKILGDDYIQYKKTALITDKSLDIFRFTQEETDEDSQKNPDDLTFIKKNKETHEKPLNEKFYMKQINLKTHNEGFDKIHIKKKSKAEMKGIKSIDIGDFNDSNDSDDKDESESSIIKNHKHKHKPVIKTIKKRPVKNKIETLDKKHAKSPKTKSKIKNKKTKPKTEEDDDNSIKLQDSDASINPSKTSIDSKKESVTSIGNKRASVRSISSNLDTNVHSDIIDLGSPMIIKEVEVEREVQKIDDDIGKDDVKTENEDKDDEEEKDDDDVDKGKDDEAKSDADEDEDKEDEEKDDDEDKSDEVKEDAKVIDEVKGEVKDDDDEDDDDDDVKSTDDLINENSIKMNKNLKSIDETIKITDEDMETDSNNAINLLKNVDAFKTKSRKISIKSNFIDESDGDNYDDFKVGLKSLENPHSKHKTKAKKKNIRRLFKTIRTKNSFHKNKNVKNVHQKKIPTKKKHKKSTPTHKRKPVHKKQVSHKIKQPIRIIYKSTRKIGKLNKKSGKTNKKETKPNQKLNKSIIKINKTAPKKEKTTHKINKLYPKLNQTTPNITKSIHKLFKNSEMQVSEESNRFGDKVSQMKLEPNEKNIYSEYGIKHVEEPNYIPTYIFEYSASKNSYILGEEGGSEGELFEDIEKNEPNHKKEEQIDEIEEENKMTLYGDLVDNVPADTQNDNIYSTHNIFKKYNLINETDMAKNKTHKHKKNFHSQLFDFLNVKSLDSTRKLRPYQEYDELSNKDNDTLNKSEEKDKRTIHDSNHEIHNKRQLYHFLNYHSDNPDGRKMRTNTTLKNSTNKLAQKLHQLNDELKNHLRNKPKNKNHPTSDNYGFLFNNMKLVTTVPTQTIPPPTPHSKLKDFPDSDRIVDHNNYTHSDYIHHDHVHLLHPFSDHSFPSQSFSNHIHQLHANHIYSTPFTELRPIHTTDYIDLITSAPYRSKSEDFKTENLNLLKIVNLTTETQNLKSVNVEPIRETGYTNLLNISLDDPQTDSYKKQTELNSVLLNIILESSTTGNIHPNSDIIESTTPDNILPTTDIQNFETTTFDSNNSLRSNSTNNKSTIKFNLSAFINNILKLNKPKSNKKITVETSNDNLIKSDNNITVQKSQIQIIESKKSETFDTIEIDDQNSKSNSSDFNNNQIESNQSDFVETSTSVTTISNPPPEINTPNTTRSKTINNITKLTANDIYLISQQLLSQNLSYEIIKTDIAKFISKYSKSNHTKSINKTSEQPSSPRPKIKSTPDLLVDEKSVDSWESALANVKQSKHNSYTSEETFDVTSKRPKWKLHLPKMPKNSKLYSFQSFLTNNLMSSEAKTDLRKPIEIKSEELMDDKSVNIWNYDRKIPRNKSELDLSEEVKFFKSKPNLGKKFKSMGTIGRKPSRITVLDKSLNKTDWDVSGEDDWDSEQYELRKQKVSKLEQVGGLFLNNFTGERISKYSIERDLEMVRSKPDVRKEDQRMFKDKNYLLVNQKVDEKTLKKPVEKTTKYSTLKNSVEFEKDEGKESGEEKSSMPEISKLKSDRNLSDDLVLNRSINEIERNRSDLEVLDKVSLKNLNVTESSNESQYDIKFIEIFENLGTDQVKKSNQLKPKPRKKKIKFVSITKSGLQKLNNGQLNEKSNKNDDKMDKFEDSTASTDNPIGTENNIEPEFTTISYYPVIQSIYNKTNFADTYSIVSNDWKASESLIFDNEIKDDTNQSKDLTDDSSKSEIEKVTETIIDIPNDQNHIETYPSLVNLHPETTYIPEIPLEPTSKPSYYYLENPSLKSEQSIFQTEQPYPSNPQNLHADQSYQSNIKSERTNLHSELSNLYSKQSNLFYHYSDRWSVNADRSYLHADRSNLHADRSNLHADQQILNFEPTIVLPQQYYLDSDPNDQFNPHPDSKSNLNEDRFVLNTKPSNIYPEQSKLHVDQSKIYSEQSNLHFEQSKLFSEQSFPSIKESNVHSEQSNSKQSRPHNEQSNHSEQSNSRFEQPDLPTEQSTVQFKQSNYLSEQSIQHLNAPILKQFNPLSEQSNDRLQQSNGRFEQFNSEEDSEQPTRSKQSKNHTKPTQPEQLSIYTELPNYEQLNISSEQPNVESKTSIISSEPPNTSTGTLNVLFKQTNNLTEQPNNYNEQPNNYNEQPNNYNEQSNNYNEQPNNYNEQPNNYNEQPNNYNEQPNNYDEQDYFAEQPNNYIEQPNRFEKQPNNLIEQPNNFVEQSNHSIAQPSNSSTQLKIISKYPEKSSKQPNNHDEQLYKLIDEPNNTSVRFNIFSEQPDESNEQPDKYNEQSDKSNEQLNDSEEQPNNYVEQPNNYVEQPNYPIERTNNSSIIFTNIPSESLNKSYEQSNNSFDDEQLDVRSEKPYQHMNRQKNLHYKQSNITFKQPNISSEQLNDLIEQLYNSSEQSDNSAEQMNKSAEQLEQYAKHRNNLAEQSNISFAELKTQYERPDKYSVQPNNSSAHSDIISEQLDDYAEQSIKSTNHSNFEEQSNHSFVQLKIQYEKPDEYSEQPNNSFARLDIISEQLDNSAEQSIKSTNHSNFEEQSNHSLKIQYEKPDEYSEQPNNSVARLDIISEQSDEDLEQPDNSSEQPNILYNQPDNFSVLYNDSNSFSERLHMLDEQLNESSEQLNILSEKINTSSEQLDNFEPDNYFDQPNISSEQLNVFSEQTNNSSEELNISSEQENISSDLPNISSEQFNNTFVQSNNSFYRPNESSEKFNKKQSNIYFDLPNISSDESKMSSRETIISSELSLPFQRPPDSDHDIQTTEYSNYQLMRSNSNITQQNISDIEFENNKSINLTDITDNNTAAEISSKEIESGFSDNKMIMKQFEPKSNEFEMDFDQYEIDTDESKIDSHPTKMESYNSEIYSNESNSDQGKLNLDPSRMNFYSSEMASDESQINYHSSKMALDPSKINLYHSEMDFSRFDTNKSTNSNYTIHNLKPPDQTTKNVYQIMISNKTINNLKNSGKIKIFLDPSDFEYPTQDFQNSETEAKVKKPYSKKKKSKEFDETYSINTLFAEGSDFSIHSKNNITFLDYKDFFDFDDMAKHFEKKKKKNKRTGRKRNRILWK